MNWDRNDVSIMKVDSWAWSIPVCHTERELIKNYINFCEPLITTQIKVLKMKASQCPIDEERHVYKHCEEKLSSFFSPGANGKYIPCHILFHVNKQLLWTDPQGISNSILFISNLELEGQSYSRKNDEKYRR